MDKTRVEVTSNRARVNLGNQGENRAKALEFDLSDWASAYGSGTVQVLMQRPGEEAPYISEADFADGILTWPITNLETAIAGEGRLQIMYRVDGAVVKTLTIQTRVEPSLGETTDPPDPWAGWVDRVVEAAEAAEHSTQSAQVSAQNTQTFAQNALASAQAAQAAVDAAAAAAEAAALAVTTETLETALESKAEVDGYYDEMTVGSAEQLISTVTTEDKVPYNFRPSGGSADIGSREADMVVGGTVVWNQLVNIGDISVTVPSRHKYYSSINSVKSIGVSTGSAININDPTKDNVIDLTHLFGSTIADYVYSLEQANTGAGVAWFKQLFPKDYYGYNAGELMSVQASAHRTVGFNAYDPATGKAKLVGGIQYQITGAYTSLAFASISGNSETITPDANGLFIPSNSGELTVTGGNDSTTCVHLVWSGYRNGEYKEYEKHSYPLDSSLTLRGIPKLDANNALYYDGDIYQSDGTVTRRYGLVDLGTLNWAYDSTHNSFLYNVAFGAPAKANGTPCNIACTKYIARPYGSNTSYSTEDKVIWLHASSTLRVRDSAYTDAADFKAAISGVNLVYELATPTTETAAPYQNPQIVDDFGTEEYVDAAVEAGTRDVAVPVGHETSYMANLRDKLQHLPDLASASGTYVISQQDNQMTLIPLITPTELPDAPASDGSYLLKATVTDGAVSYSWEVQA